MWTCEEELTLLRRGPEQIRWLEALQELTGVHVVHWLRDAPAEAQLDREVILAAVSRYGTALEWASPELKADRDVVLAAVARNGSALDYASADLQADRDVVLAAVAKYGGVLEFAS